MNYKGLQIEIIKIKGTTVGFRKHINCVRWTYKFSWTRSDNGETNYLGTSHKVEPLKRDAIINAKEYANYIVSKKDFYKIK